MNSITRRVLLACTLITVFAVGIAVGKNKFGQPKSIVHVVTVKWKADSTAEQRQKALDGVKTMATEMPGITNVWLKSEKSQGKDAAFVMEFKDAAAFKAYADHPAHKKWEGLYLPVREESATSDITN